METPFSTMEAPNRRIANLKRWLAKPPRAAARARLLRVEDPPRVLREYSLDQLQPGLAHEIDADTRDEAAEDGAPVCEYMLVFESEDGRSITTHKFAVRSAPQYDDALQTAAGIEATKESVMVMLQRHCEVMARVSATNNQVVVQQLITANQQLMQLNEALATRVLDAYSREDQARDTVHALREMLVAPQDDEPREPNPSEQAVANALQALLPILAQRLLAGGPRMPPQNGGTTT